MHYWRKEETKRHIGNVSETEQDRGTQKKTEGESGRQGDRSQTEEHRGNEIKIEEYKGKQRKTYINKEDIHKQRKMDKEGTEDRGRQGEAVTLCCVYSVSVFTDRIRRS